MEGWTHLNTAAITVTAKHLNGYFWPTQEANFIWDEVLHGLLDIISDLPAEEKDTPTYPSLVKRII